MRAIQVAAPGSADVMSVVELEPPPPGRGEVQVRIRAAGVNFIDLHHRTGRYPADFPMILGGEGAGTVIAVGEGVAEVEHGTDVAFVLPGRSAESRAIGGAYAEVANVPADHVVPLPAGVGFNLAAALMLQGLTAHYLVTDCYRIGHGETGLIHAAAGGVGLLLVQLAKRAGARVIGTVSTEDKERAALAAGADSIIRYTEEDFADGVATLTGGRGVDVVYDAVGRDTFKGSLACLRTRGCLVLYGQASGKADPLDPHSLNPAGSVTLVVPGLAHYISSREELLSRAADLFGWVQAGELSVRIDRTFPLVEAADAHRYLEQRRTIGKVLLVP